MPLDWSPFVEFVRQPTRFVLLTHVRPDGDALGSQFGMADLLEQLGKQPRIVIGSRFPDRYHFMDPDKRIQRFGPGNDCFAWAEAVIVLDTGVWGQLGECGKAMQERAVPKIVIDHHLTQDDLGAIRLVDTTAEATGRLVAEAFDAVGKTPAPFAANSLFIALAMDTGWFHHANMRADTFTLAARLVEAGADPHEAFEQLYERNSLARTRLLGRILDRMQTVAEGKVAFSEVYLSDYPATGAVPADTEDFVQHTRAIAGVEVGILLIEQLDGSVKVSFRSRDQVNVAQVAATFGGGGHARASGATIPGPIAAAREKALAAVQHALTTPRAESLPTLRPSPSAG
jgi:phosphoesterase RecJ-like protein